MTVALVMNIHRWIGESTDVKPEPGTEKAGSTFYELDTGVAFIWNGDNWVEDLTLIYALTEALKE